MKTKFSLEKTHAFAKGGSTKMLKEVLAGPQKPGTTTTAVKGSGGKAARGGGAAPVPGRVLTAKAGRTGVR